MLAVSLESDYFSFYCHISEYGEKGQLVKVRPIDAYKRLLLPKLATYASPENLQKYVIKKITTESNFVSRSVSYVSMLQ